MSSHGCYLPTPRRDGETLICYVCGRVFKVVWRDDGILGHLEWVTVLDSPPMD